MAPKRKAGVTLVTGGTGLYGSAIREYVEGASDENVADWVFLSSSDGDLRDRKNKQTTWGGGTDLHSPPGRLVGLLALYFSCLTVLAA